MIEQRREREETHALVVCLFSLLFFPTTKKDKLSSWNEYPLTDPLSLTPSERTNSRPSSISSFFSFFSLYFIPFLVSLF